MLIYVGQQSVTDKSLFYNKFVCTGLSHTLVRLDASSSPSPATGQVAYFTLSLCA